nr:succinate dehydrogenase assembly factor 2, mitochondrial-like isoform X3 [Ziziphus jujuba var. spinosa]
MILFILFSLNTPFQSTLIHLSRSLLGCVNAGFYRFYLNNFNSLAIDLSDKESKRCLFIILLYKSRQRGFLELDLVIRKWVEEHIHSMDENGIKALCHVLDLKRKLNQLQAIM